MPDPFRLPHHVVPSRYDLRITPSLPTATFHGEVGIDLEIRESVDVIVCNAIELTFASASLDGVPVRSITLDELTERATLHLGRTVGPGHHRLMIAYDGILNDKLRGFYRSVWTDAAGAEHVLGTTQMQATDARRAFPCWDEPEFKATFAITLVIPEELQAISNSPEIGREAVGNGMVAINFSETMVMSTYLLAWVVGELEFSETIDVDGVALRVVNVPGKGHLAGFALDCGAFGLRWFQQYYGIDYPGDKVDLVALPDFAAGAMENLGCITFRESLLLIDPHTATQPDLSNVADVVLHELAHMWFGDLVTMRWWNGIWLNEAFATFMEVAAADAYRPDWKRWNSFSNERQIAFDADGLLATRAIEFEVVSPADAQAMFDVLTYQKGGALLRMLEQYLGPDRFRAGVARYLRTHAYGSTETSDLWDALEAETGEPVRSVMDSWIWQGGHPLVSAAIADGDLVLSQQRLLLDPAGASEASAAQFWQIPIIVRNGSTELRTVLGEEPQRLALVDPSAPTVVNAGGHGFYRVAYSDDLLARLAGHTLGALSAVERYALVDDAWNAVVSGRRDAAWFCDLVRRFGDETDLPTWQVILAGLRWCDRFVDGQAREGLRRFVRALVGGALGRLGWAPRPEDDDLTGELRGELLTALAVLGVDPDARTYARDLLDRAWSGEDLHPALVASAVTVTASFGGPDEHAMMVERFEHSATPQETLRYLYALAAFPGQREFESTLELATSARVRSQNAPYLLHRCLANRDLGSLAWKFVSADFDTLEERFPVPSVIRMVEGVRTITNADEVASVQGFFASHPLPAAGKTLSQILERQRINAGLRSRTASSLSTLAD